MYTNKGELGGRASIQQVEGPYGPYQEINANLAAAYKTVRKYVDMFLRTLVPHNDASSLIFRK